MTRPSYDAAIVGGGFFGCAVAAFLRRKMKRVLILEQEQQLFTHASYCNQARIHNGYHYPRSLRTAYRSRVNFPSFIHDFPECVINNFTKLYCVGRQLSKVTPIQFERFCDLIGAPWKRASREYAQIFDPRLIAATYEVVEYAFDSDILRDSFRTKLDKEDVEIQLGTRVERIESSGHGAALQLSNGDEVQTEYLFNCTYAGLKSIQGIEEHCKTSLKYEITEMALIEPPAELAGLGITVMCGPFFSMMPFPARSLHTLSHVRYTPHASWMDDGPGTKNPYEVLEDNRKKSHAELMLRDSARYLPLLSEAQIRDSLFEVKTLLVRNEIDDGRPILIERSLTNPKVYTIMGGKVDNIYDVYSKLQADGL